MPEDDGKQPLVFYYVDLFEAFKRLLSSPTFLNKQYTGFERQVSKSHPDQRVFGKINGCLWFEQMSLRFPEERIAGMVLNSDGSFFGAHKEGHPVYSKSSIKKLHNCIIMTL